MPGLDETEFNLQSISIPHEFEVDLNYLVITNHKLTLEGIARAEEQDVAKLEPTSPEDFEGMRPLQTDAQQFYGDLRQAANNLAVVALVTRMGLWIARFVKEVKKSDKASNLFSNLTLLNERLGDGPVPVEFFQELVNVRDSVIHANSRAEWRYRDSLRCVAEKYAVYGGVAVDEEQFMEAIANTIRQAKWYDEKVQQQRIFT